MISIDILAMEKLIEKYDKPGPRYTSFPALPFWKNNLETQTWISHVGESLDAEGAIDLYIHIPFCQKLCWYCGCNRIITKNRDRSIEYIEALENEWKFYTNNFPHIKIKSIHFGGGTPTFLPNDQLNQLLGIFQNYIDESFIGSIEIDPRTVDIDQLNTLRKFGFKRASLGIQDFDEEVQIAINRIQSYELVETIVGMLRQTGFESINFDLIFGLPKQSIQSIKDTISKVSTLNPDLLAFYSYAHLPERIANQKLINEEFLPTGNEKRALYDEGKKALFENGYHEVGMDHFAKKESYLYQAFDKRKLHRSFMGYTDTKSSTLIGIGATSISNTKKSFRQNEKDVKNYIEQMSEVNIPNNQTSHNMEYSDQITNEIIQSLMCNLQADISLLKDLEIWNAIQSGLVEFEKDKLVRTESDMLYITELGRVFLRNICMIFDPYLGKKGAMRFSQTV
jgi:oxygen-independent coproporphyrinogen III oxidase